MLNKKNIVMISQLKRGQPSIYTSAVYKNEFKPSFNFRKNSYNVQQSNSINNQRDSIDLKPVCKPE